MPNNTPTKVIINTRLSNPQTQSEWDQYYLLRWQVLRKPWGQPPGSERDEHESNAYHLIAKVENDLIVGVGRLHQINTETAQIRYMATDERYHRNGIGTQIIKALEQQAKQWHLAKIILNARNDFLTFYSTMGYQPTGKGTTLFSTIHHTKMQKHI